MVALAMLALPACHAGVGVGPAVPTAGDFLVVERAETGPITALAAKAPYLWAAGAPGLRRWDVSSGEYEVVGDGDAKGTQALTAIAIDDEGSAWVASADETGRWVVDKTRKGSARAALPDRRVAGRRRRAGAAAAGEDQGRLGGRPGRALSLRRASLGDRRWPARRGGHLAGARRRRRHRLGRHARRAASTAPTTTARSRCRAVRRSAVTQIVGDGEDRGRDARGGGQRQRRCAPLRAHAGRHRRAARAARDPRRGAGPEGERGGARRRVRSGSEAGLRAARPRRRRAGPLGGPAVLARRGRESRTGPGRPPSWRCRRAVTAAAAVGTDLYVGSIALGVARAEAGRPRHLEGSELVGDADRFTVACRAHDHCLVVTDGPHAWQTDGDHYQAASVGEPKGATVLAVAADHQGNVFAVSAETPFNGLTITRRAAGTRRTGRWRARVPLQLPARTAPKASFAAISPVGRALDRVAAGGWQRRRRRLRCGGDRSADGPARAAPSHASPARRPRSRRCRCPPISPACCSTAARPGLPRCRASPLPAGAARHLGRERRSGQRALLERDPRRRRRDLGGDLRRARALRRQELAPGGGGARWPCTASPPTTRGGCGWRPPRGCASSAFRSRAPPTSTERRW